MTLAPHEKELVVDLVESHGWQLLCFKVLPELIRSKTNSALTAIRDDNLVAAALATGRRDGLLDAIDAAYKAAGVPMNELLKKRMTESA